VQALGGEFDGIEEKEAEAVAGGVVEVALAAMEGSDEVGVLGTPAVEGAGGEAERVGGLGDISAGAEERDGGVLAWGEGGWSRTGSDIFGHLRCGRNSRRDSAGRDDGHDGPPLKKKT
jgi:hypothetical protein